MTTPTLRERTERVEAQRGEVATRTRTVADAIRELTPQIADALPSGVMRPEQFIRIVLTELRRNPRLQEANRASLFGAIMNAAQQGLDIGTEFYLTGPFKMRSGLEVVGIRSYLGDITLALRDPRVLAVSANVVHEGDTFSHEYGDGAHLRHVPALDNDDAPMVAAWAQVKMETPGGSIVHVHKVIGPREVEKARARSRAKDDGPWVTDYEAMARKTAIHRLLRGGEVPLRREVALAVGMDDRPIHYDLDANELAPLEEPVIEAVASEEEPKRRPRQRAEEQPEPEPEPDVPDEEPPPEAS